MTKKISNINAFKMAEDIKAHVESGETGLPSSLTYDNVTYTWADMMYIMPYMVKNPFKSICEVPTLISPESPWKGDNINEQVKQADFEKQAENILNFVKNNKNLIPNYVTTIKSRLRVNANHYTYCFAKTFAYFNNHDHVLPRQCLYKSSDVKQETSTTSNTSNTSTNTSNTVKPSITGTHYGYWVFGRDMTNVNLSDLKNKGVTDIFLNYYAFTTHGESKVLSWIKEAKQNNINVHIWVQAFYDGEWHNPKTTDLTNKKNEIKKYANLDGVYGIHLDYLRYPGTAYKTDGGSDAITQFVKEVHNQNPNTILTCAVMPESELKYYYGQDLEALGKIVDAIVPMAYKGNYNKGTDWLKSITSNFGKYATIWTGLQAYKSDENTSLLSVDELKNDIKSCLDGGAKGIILFRYGLTQNIDFTSSTTTAVNNTTNSNQSTVKKYSHATKSGCDNMGQNNSVYCGPHSLQEVIRNLTGIVVPQSTLAGWAGTTSAGTSHQGLETAVAQFNKKYSKNLKVTWKYFSEVGWSGIDKIIKSNNQDAIIHNLYRRTESGGGDGHYEVVNAVSNNVNVQNSLGSKCSNGCYCGYIEYRSQSTFTYYINGISQKSVMVITNA